MYYVKCQNLISHQLYYYILIQRYTDRDEHDFIIICYTTPIRNLHTVQFLFWQIAVFNFKELINNLILNNVLCIYKNHYPHGIN